MTLASRRIQLLHQHLLPKQSNLANLVHCQLLQTHFSHTVKLPLTIWDQNSSVIVKILRDKIKARSQIGARGHQIPLHTFVGVCLFDYIHGVSLHHRGPVTVQYRRLEQNCKI